MLVAYKLDQSSTAPRVVEVTVPDGLSSPRAISEEAMAKLVEQRAAGAVAPWRTAVIESVDGKPWHGIDGERERMARRLSELDAGAGPA